MRTLTSMAVLLAVVGTVLVGVRQQGELRRLEQQVWDEMRRRDGLAKQVREAEARLATELSPRTLLEERDRRLRGEPDPDVAPRATAETGTDAARGGEGE